MPCCPICECDHWRCTCPEDEMGRLKINDSMTGEVLYNTHDELIQRPPEDDPRLTDGDTKYIKRDEPYQSKKFDFNDLQDLTREFYTKQFIKKDAEMEKDHLKKEWERLKANLTPDELADPERLFYCGGLAVLSALMIPCDDLFKELQKRLDID